MADKSRSVPVSHRTQTVKNIFETFNKHYITTCKDMSWQHLGNFLLFLGVSAHI